MNSVDGNEYECWKCGWLEYGKVVPDGWYQIPHNVSVYFCPSCNKERLRINETYRTAVQPA